MGRPGDPCKDAAFTLSDVRDFGGFEEGSGMHFRLKMIGLSLRGE